MWCLVKWWRTELTAILAITFTKTGQTTITEKEAKWNSARITITEWLKTHTHTVKSSIFVYYEASATLIHWKCILMYLCMRVCVLLYRIVSSIYFALAEITISFIYILCDVSLLKRKWNRNNVLVFPFYSPLIQTNSFHSVRHFEHSIYYNNV